MSHTLNLNAFALGEVQILPGTVWIEVDEFMQPIERIEVGVYAGNKGTPAPAHTAIVDDFFSNDFPIVPENV